MPASMQNLEVFAFSSNFTLRCLDAWTLIMAAFVTDICTDREYETWQCTPEINANAESDGSLCEQGRP